MRVTLTRGSLRVTDSFIKVTLTTLLPPFFFRFLVLFRVAAFYMAFVFVMPPLATKAARNCAGEVILMLYVLPIFGFLFMM